MLCQVHVCQSYLYFWAKDNGCWAWVTWEFYVNIYSLHVKIRIASTTKGHILEHDLMV